MNSNKETATELTKKALQHLGLNEWQEGSGYLKLSCPLWQLYHEKPDNNPSFVIWPEPLSQKQAQDEEADVMHGWSRCFSCGYSAPVVDFLQFYADHHSKEIDLTKLSLIQLLNFGEEVEYFNPILNECVLDGFGKDEKAISDYLTSRKINAKMLNNLLFDKSFKNIVCPVRNFNGDLVGATGRSTVTKMHHHYLGLSTGKSILGLEQISEKNVLIVEGLTDYLNAKSKMKELGLDFSVLATLTCNITDWQAREIIDLGKPVYLAYDLDTAGLKAREKCLPKLKDCIRAYDLRWNFKDQEGKLKDIGDFSLEEIKTLLKGN